MRLGGMTVQEDDGKKTTELMSCLHISGLLETFFPLPIILQKATGETGCFERCMQFTLICPKILPRFGTWDSGQEGPEVKALSSIGVDKVHPADDVTLTTWLPLPCFLLPNELLGKFVISDVLCTWQSGIGSEPLCERGLLEGLTVQQHLWVVIFIIMDIMFVFKMD